MQRLIGWLLGSVLLLYLAFTVYQQRAEIAALPWRLSWHPFACVACLMLAQALVGVGTSLHLHALGARGRLQQVLRVHFLGQVAKYLPLGGVLNVTTQTVGLAQEAPGGARSGMLAVLLNLATTAAFGVSWFGLQESLRGAPLLGPIPAALLVGAAPILLVLLAGGWLPRFVTGGLAVAYPPMRLVALACSACLAWMLFGLSLVLLSGSLMPLEAESAWAMHGALPGAWALGVASFVVPAGLGIRDGALVFLLGRIVPGPLAGVLALMHRLLWLLADVLNAAVGSLLLARPQRDSSV